MRADGISNVLDGDSVQMLVVAGGFHKKLLVQIIQIVLHKHVNITHDLQDIHSLPQGKK